MIPLALALVLATAPDPLTGETLVPLAAVIASHVTFSFTTPLYQGAGYPECDTTAVVIPFAPPLAHSAQVIELWASGCYVPHGEMIVASHWNWPGKRDSFVVIVPACWAGSSWYVTARNEAGRSCLSNRVTP